MALIRRLLPNAALLGLVLLAGCTGQEMRPVETQDTSTKSFEPWTDEVPPYRYGAGDELEIKFLMTPEMDEQTLVAPDGTIALRAAGQVQAADRTQPELKQDIEQKSRSILLHPDVTVLLRKPASWKVYVGGQVRTPAAYLIDGRIGVVEAVMLAGGFTDVARLDEVVLIRRNKDNRPMLRTVDVHGFLETGDPGKDVPLVAGDIIFVPRSKIGEVDLWVEQFITKVVPFDRSFSYSIYSNTAPVW